MKIAFVVSEFPALSETFILNQITGLIDLGHEVDVFAVNPRQEEKVHPDVQKYGLLEHTYYQPRMPKILSFRLLKALWLLFSNLDKGLRDLFGSLNVLRHGRKAMSLQLLYAAIPVLSNGPYQIVHAHFGWNGIVGMELQKAGMLRGNLITTFHGADMSSALHRNGDNHYAELFAHGDLFLTVSERWRKKLLELGCDEKKVKVHRMGVDCEMWNFKEREVQNDGSVKIITIARLVEKKGLEYGIRAVGKLTERYPQVEYSIIGSGPMEDDLRRLVHKLNLGKRVTLLGCKDQNEILSVMQSSHIFLAPSVTAANGDQEGIPVVLMEAMAAGMPVVTTRHSGIPELVEEGTSGFLLPERDVDSLSQRLAYLLDNPGVWGEMGRQGRKKIESEFNVKMLNRQLVEIYQSIL